MIVGILLAGGASARFGGPKLLHVLPDGLTIAERSARNLLAAVDHVLVVARPGDERLADRLRRLGCEVLVTARALEGMGGSLSAAIEAAADASGWVMALADMPFIESATILRVREALERGALIAAPVLPTGERGHPVGFSVRLADELKRLSGDSRARGIIDRHAEEVVRLACDDRGIVVDIDTPDDLER